MTSMESLLTQAEILWPAMLAGLLVLATHVPLGREVLQRGIIFLDLAIAQMAALGVVAAGTASRYLAAPVDAHGHTHGHSLADSFELSENSMAVIAATLASFLLCSLRRLDVRVQEALIGILFVLSATGSILLLAADPHGGERLKEILVGQILWLSPGDLVPLLLVYAVVLLIWRFSSERLNQWLFYPLFAITITLSTQVVGVYLVFASLMIPALATLGHRQATARAFLMGAMAYLVGLCLAALFDLPAGATIVWSLAGVAILYWLSVRLAKACIGSRHAPQLHRGVSHKD